MTESQDIPEVIDIDHYDPDEFKLKWSVKWLISKGFRHVPEDLVEPFYRKENIDHELRLKSATLYALTSGELYCAAAAVIFGDSGYLNSSHSAVLQALSRHGIHCSDLDEKAVTETMLRLESPIKISAHLAMIDCLMMAYMRQVLSVDKVVAAVRKHTKVNANEVPSNLEESLLFWINKICGAVRDKLESDASQNGNEVPTIPEMEDLYEEIYDCCCLSTLISFYCPDKLPLKDVCFNEPMSVADSIHNIQLVQRFCRQLPADIFFCTYEDFLYTADVMKPNIDAFITDLFFCFEGSAVPAQSSTEFKRAVAKHPFTDGRRLLNNDNFANIRGVPTALKPSLPQAPTDGLYSVSPSVMNSMDSLATSRTVDSLKYTTYRHTSMDSPTTPTGPQRNGFVTVPRSDPRDSGMLPKSPTTSFAELTQSAHYASTTLPKKLSSSGPNPSTNGSIPSTSVLTTNITPIRLQLEEKRQQYEREKQMKEADSLRNRQNLGQQAFMTALGKTPPTSLSNSVVSGGSPSLMTRSMFASPTASRVSPKAKQEDSAVIQEMQEQIRRLSMQQTQLQQLISTGKGSGDELDLGQSNTTRKSSVPQAHESEKGSNTSFRQGFRLHSENSESDGRQEPELELRRDLKNFGMTYRVRNSMEVEDLEPPAAFVLNQRTAAPRNSLNAESDVAAQQLLERSKTFHRGEPVNFASLVPEANEKPQVAGSDYAMNLQRQPRPKTTSMSSGEGDQFLPPLSVSTTNMSDAQLLGVESLPSPVRHAETRQQRENSPGFNFIVGDDQKQRDLEMQKKKEQILLAAMRRKEEMEEKRIRAEAEATRKRQETERKQEEAERKKMEKDVHRQKIMETYRQKKVDQELVDNPTISSPMRPKPSRGHSQPPVRPKSQVVMMMKSSQSREANISAMVGSADNIDLGGDNVSHGGSETGSSGEPSLKLFVKPVQKSNRSIMYNALQYSCLPGAVNDSEKRKVLDELAKSDSKHFLVLFRDGKCQFRALYAWDQVSDTAFKLYGTGPKSVAESQMTMMYKYDSGSKTFNQIPSKHLSATIDGFTLPDSFWQKKKVPFSSAKK